MKYSFLIFFIFAGCGAGQSNSRVYERTDGAYMLDIDLSGSLQNPSFSPDGTSILFTRFRDGYNKGVSDLFVYNLQTEKLRTLLSDDWDMSIYLVRPGVKRPVKWFFLQLSIPMTRFL